MPFSFLKGVVFVVMRPDKTFLLQLRDNNSKHYKNMWCFPGGRCNYQELYIDAVIRELYEEYEITLEKEDCKYFTTQRFGFKRVFLCRVDINQKPVLHEGADMKWMNLEEIKKIKLGFNQSKIVYKLEKNLNSKQITR